MSKPIATRVLYNVEDKSEKYSVHVFAPVLTPNGVYQCKIRIDGAPEGLNEMDIGGTDGYQALLLAIESLYEMVEVFNKNFMNSKLRWNEDSVLDLGFSVSTDD